MIRIKSVVALGVVGVGLLFLSFDQPKLVKTKIGNMITVMLPKGWRPMDDYDLTNRYRSVRAPLGAYTSEDRLFDFSVNISATQWPDENLELASQFFKAGLMNMFDRVDMIREGIHTVNGRKLIFFEYESRVEGNKTGLKDPVLKYTYIQYLVEADRTLVFSFNCPREYRKEWQSTVHAIMASIQVK